MNLAFGYIRRSSYKQQENNSVEIQKAHIQEFAKRNNLEIPEEFIFIEDVTSAYSKRASQRRELMRLRDKMIEVNVPRVIFYEVSRMNRTGYTFVLDFYKPLQEKLPDLKVYTTNSEEPFNPDSPQTKIALLLFQQESEIKPERATGSLIADLEQEEIFRPGSKVPYGYNQVNKKLVPNDKAEIITFIYYLHSWGTSIKMIAAILSEAGIPSPQGKTWRSSTIENILKNPVYTGLLLGHVQNDANKRQRYTFENAHEPLIDSFSIQLNENNTKLQNEYGRLNTPFLFLNKLSCRHCQQKLQTQNGSTSRKGIKYCYQYYVCKTCKYKIQLDDVHKKILPLIFKHVQKLAKNKKSKSAASRYLEKVSQVVQENIINIEERLDKLISKGCIANENDDRLFESLAKSVKQQLLASLKALLDSQHTLEELNEAVSTDLFFDRFKTILDEQLGTQEKRLITLYFVDEVLISPDHPLQIKYWDNAFESFNLLPYGQSAEI